MIKKNKFGCFLKLLGLILICCVAFVVVIGGSAAIDKSVDKLCEYRDSVSNKIANKLGLQLAEKDTAACIVEDTIPKRVSFSPGNDNVIKIKLEILDNMMFIKPKINGIEMRCMLDTGCSDIHLGCSELVFMIHQGIIDKDEYVEMATCVYADGSEHQCPVYIIKNIEIGGIKLDSVKCTAETSGDSMPLFGQAVLKKLGDVSINYSDSTLIIKKKYGK
jgi:predicted aspartyl protease